ncbi:MAG: NADH-ubiquinone oxidoreductase [Candidatus Tokpelaia hoelldobleri]|uniref:NADH-ubiquinone oxidoreductase n=1 Tax=Candidatus Tokpelaia hoelldobleri TaxID=1902579 RepID=A0A1U9JV71_9HYPH|nr:MAG: NADH-ubiquinone oxidoreductase [Candidatus Tokpelaia hoelldoblerii]
MVARIYSPAKTAMQSGKASSANWVLQYEPAVVRMIEPLMGYTSTTDMNGQVSVSFPSLEEAEAFAARNGIAYQVLPKHEAKRLKVSYSDNFRTDRSQPWTH